MLLLSHFSCVQLCATPQTAAHQASPSLGFSRQEHWSGLPFPLQCMQVKSESEVVQSCLTPSDPMDYSLPGSSVHGIFQARVLEWVAIAFSEIQPQRIYLGFPGGSVVKNSPANAGDMGWIHGSGRSPGEGNGNVLQYSCLENSMDRGAWRTTVNQVTKEQDMTYRLKTTTKEGLGSFKNKIREMRQKLHLSFCYEIKF